MVQQVNELDWKLMYVTDRSQRSA